MLEKTRETIRTQQDTKEEKQNLSCPSGYLNLGPVSQ